MHHLPWFRAAQLKLRLKKSSGFGPVVSRAESTPALPANLARAKANFTIIIAAVTTGGEWPCGEGQAPLGNVIILSAEDGAADTIIPRLLAAGADETECMWYRPFATPTAVGAHLTYNTISICSKRKSRRIGRRRLGGGRPGVVVLG